MALVDEQAASEPGGPFAPLRERSFRTLWFTSLFSNFGQLILGVGAAWEMTRLTSSPTMVALVQTALMLPLMLIAVPAGAVADMFDRRKTAMAGLGFSIVTSSALAILSTLGYTGPWVLLAFCSLIGAGVAFFSPAWQASIREQVTPEQLPAAVALGSISYNVARSFGPALGGIIVAAAGAKAAFGVNSLCYIPLFLGFAFWKRAHVPSRLPPERIDRAIQAGLRYAVHSPPVRTVLTRAFLYGLSSASYGALAALIARNLLGGDASTFGLLLGAAGVGAVVGALAMSHVRKALSAERAFAIAGILAVLALVTIGVSHSVALTAFGFLVVGGTGILTISLMNVSVQMSAPRWVTARALSLFSSALTGGIAAGAIIWGQVAAHWNVETALIGSGGAMLLTVLLGRFAPLPQPVHEDMEQVDLGELSNIALDVTMRSGPVAIEIDYVVDPARARDFYGVMLQMQRIRQRNGGFNWTIARDIADPALWTERYECPTWGDYLRMRDRFTLADREVQAQADAFHSGGQGARIRRRLERPFGSVRWRADSVDPRQETIDFLTP
jgi:MFS family permease